MKKSIIFLIGLLSLSLLIGSAAADPQIIDGYYQIGTVSDLQWFAQQVNAGHVTYNAKLTADIDLSGVTWTPMGTESNMYAGTFDGDGHIISNLYMKYQPISNFITFLGSGCVIKNILFENVYIHTNKGDSSPTGYYDGVCLIGGVGDGGSAEIYNIGIDGDSQFIHDAPSNGMRNRCSSLLWDIQGVNLHDVYSMATVTVSGKNCGDFQSFYGGIATICSGRTGSMTNVYFGGNIQSVGSHTSGLVPEYDDGTYNIDSCAFIGTVSGTSSSKVYRISAPTRPGATLRLSNNYGSSSVEHAGSAGVTTVNGADVSPSTYHTQSFWQNTVGFDFTNTWYWDEEENLPKLRVFQITPADVLFFTPTPAYGSTTADVRVVYNGMTRLILDAVLLGTQTQVGQLTTSASGSGDTVHSIPIYGAAQYSQDGKPVFLTLRAYDSANPTEILATSLFVYVPSDYDDYYAEIKLENAYENRYYISGDKPKITAYFYLPAAKQYLTLRSYLEIYNPATGQVTEMLSLQQHATYPNGYDMITPGETNVGQITLEYTSQTPVSGDYIARVTHYDSGEFEYEHLVLAELDYYILTILTPSGELRIPNDELIYDTSTLETGTNSAAIFYDYYNMPFGGKIEVINTNTDEIVHTHPLDAHVEREGLNFRYRPMDIPPLGASGITYQVKMTPYQSDGTDAPAVATDTFTMLREAPEYTLTVTPQTIDYGQSVTIDVTYQNFVHGATLNITAETSTPASTNLTVGTAYSGSNTFTYTPTHADTHYNVTLCDGTEIIAYQRFYVNPEPAAATLVISPPNPEPGNTVAITYTYNHFINSAATLRVTPQGASTTTYNIGSASSGSGSVQYTTSSSGNLNYTVTIYDGNTPIQIVTFKTQPRHPAAAITINPENPAFGDRVTIQYTYNDFRAGHAYLSITPSSITVQGIYEEIGTASSKTGIYRYNPPAAGITYTVKIYDGQFAQTPIAQTTFTVSNSTGTPISPLNQDFWSLGEYDGTYTLDNYRQAVNWIGRMSVPSSLVSYFDIASPEEYKLEHGLTDDDVGWYDASLGFFARTFYDILSVILFPIQYLFNVTAGVILVFEDVFGWATTQLTVPIMIITAIIELIPDELMNVALLLFGFDLFFLFIHIFMPEFANGVQALNYIRMHPGRIRPGQRRGGGE